MKLISHVIRLLNSNRVEVKIVHLKGLWGLCDYEDSELFVRKGMTTNNQITTLIHECLHFLNPSWGERLVLQAEKRVYDSLTHKEKEFLEDFIKERR